MEAYVRTPIHTLNRLGNCIAIQWLLLYVAVYRFIKREYDLHV